MHTLDFRFNGFGLNVWNYKTEIKEIDGFISQWESSDDPTRILEDAMGSVKARGASRVLYEPLFNSDMVMLYFDQKDITELKLSESEMSLILRDIFIQTLWLTYQGEHTENRLKKEEFFDKCASSMELSTFGKKLDMVVEDVI